MLAPGISRRWLRSLLEMRFVSRLLLVRIRSQVYEHYPGTDDGTLQCFGATSKDALETQVDFLRDRSLSERGR